MLRFFAFGDWGTGDSFQFEVASALSTYCQVHGCDFGILLGDNFYESGVKSTMDPQWEQKFEAVYTLELPFYAVLGNHDYEGEEQAQIDYQALQNRWKMPARNYQVRFPFEASAPLLELFAVDSNALDDAAAMALSLALDSSAATWKIVAMHHPLYSDGPHPDDELGQNALLLPLICPAVDLVLVGHNHLFSQLDDPNDGCRFQQFTVGTGGRGLHAIHPDSRTLFAEASHGFAWLEVTETSLAIEFRRVDGSLAHRHQLDLP